MWRAVRLAACHVHMRCRVNQRLRPRHFGRGQRWRFRSVDSAHSGGSDTVHSAYAANVDACDAVEAGRTEGVAWAYPNT